MYESIVTPNILEVSLELSSTLCASLGSLSYYHYSKRRCWSLNKFFRFNKRLNSCVMKCDICQPEWSTLVLPALEGHHRAWHVQVLSYFFIAYKYNITCQEIQWSKGKEMMGTEDPEVIWQMTMWSVVLDMGTTELQATSAINMNYHHKTQRKNTHLGPKRC